MKIRGSREIASVRAFKDMLPYLIAEIVVIPLTGWLARVFSVRRYLLANAILFLAFSAACAFAQNLAQMIVLRASLCFGVEGVTPLELEQVPVVTAKSTLRWGDGRRRS